MLLLGCKNAMERVASFLLEMDRRLAGSRHDGAADVPHGILAIIWGSRSKRSRAHCRSFTVTAYSVLGRPSDRAAQSSAAAQHGCLSKLGIANAYNHTPGTPHQGPSEALVELIDLPNFPGSCCG